MYEKSSAEGRDARYSGHKTDYYLLVEVYDDKSVRPIPIKSEAYDWPIHQALASTEVEVYTDDSGWHHALDGFHFKKRRTEPDLFQEDAEDEFRYKEKEHRISFGDVLFVMIIIIGYVLPKIMSWLK